jgi:hypothetical protein
MRAPALRFARGEIPTPLVYSGWFSAEGPRAPPSSRVALSFVASLRSDPTLRGVLMYKSGSFVVSVHKTLIVPVRRIMVPPEVGPLGRGDGVDELSP